MPRPNPSAAGCESAPVQHLAVAKIKFPVASRVQAPLGWWQLVPAQCSISLYFCLGLSPGLTQGTVPPKVLPPCVAPRVPPPRLRGTRYATCNGQWERPRWAAPSMQGARCKVQRGRPCWAAPTMQRATGLSLVGCPPRATCNVQRATGTSLPGCLAPCQVSGCPGGARSSFPRAVPPGHSHLQERGAPKTVLAEAVEGGEKADALGEAVGRGSGLRSPPRPSFLLQRSCSQKAGRRLAACPPAS